MKVFDLRSDTFTKPTPAMKQAMFDAEVGDDVFGEDPSINQLEKEAAEMFGKEAGLFCPSGTMTNQIGIGVHVNIGDEVICHNDYHVYRYEGAGIAANSGAQAFVLPGELGKFSSEDLENAIHPNDSHYPTSKLLVLENTINRAGGGIWNWIEANELVTIAREKGLKTHLDGARLFNALVASGEHPKEWGALFDTISLCLSKGLGCPVGSVLIGSKEDIAKAHRLRKRLGGGMRQAGFLAAAGSYALKNHIDRLEVDHKMAADLANIVKGYDFVSHVLPTETNIVIFHLKDKALTIKLADHLNQSGILCMPFGPDSIRFVTHLDVDADVTEALKMVLDGFSR